MRARRTRTAFFPSENMPTISLSSPLAMVSAHVRSGTLTNSLLVCACAILAGVGLRINYNIYIYIYIHNTFNKSLHLRLRVKTRALSLSISLSLSLSLSLSISLSLSLSLSLLCGKRSSSKCHLSTSNAMLGSPRKQQLLSRVQAKTSGHSV